MTQADNELADFADDFDEEGELHFKSKVHWGLKKAAYGVSHFSFKAARAGLSGLIASVNAGEALAGMDPFLHVIFASTSVALMTLHARELRDQVNKEQQKLIRETFLHQWREAVVALSKAVESDVDSVEIHRLVTHVQAIETDLVPYYIVHDNCPQTVSELIDDLVPTATLNEYVTRPNSETTATSMQALVHQHPNRQRVSLSNTLFVQMGKVKEQLEHVEDVAKARVAIGIEALRWEEEDNPEHLQLDTEEFLSDLESGEIDHAVAALLDACGAEPSASAEIIAKYVCKDIVAVREDFSEIVGLSIDRLNTMQAAQRELTQSVGQPRRSIIATPVNGTTKAPLMGPSSAAPYDWNADDGKTLQGPSII